MKIIAIKKHKKINKSQYISHKNHESFLLKTLPSFIQAYKTYRHQQYKEIQDNWTCKITSLLEKNTEKLIITWLGHASFLIQYCDITIITDPIFNSLPFFPRLTTHGISVDLLPPIDVVLISHNHHDHMDLSTLFHLAYRYKHLSIAVPEGDRKWLPSSLFSSINECAWHDELILESVTGAIARCTFLPAYHWSRRGPFDTNQSLWGSWVIKIGEHSIYFAGDTAYFEHFKEIGNTHEINVALLPIAPIEPSITMTQSHMNPNDAGQAFFDLSAEIFIPMHWGTFQFGVDNWGDPISLLQQWQEKNNEKLLSENKKLCMLKIGESFEVTTTT